MKFKSTENNTENSVTETEFDALKTMLEMQIGLAKTAIDSAQNTLKEMFNLCDEKHD